MIQHSEFHDGSFVLHKVIINGRKYSAWYDREGNLKDAERFSPGSRKSFSVPQYHYNVRDRLGYVGGMYAKWVDGVRSVAV